MVRKNQAGNFPVFGVGRVVQAAWSHAPWLGLLGTIGFYYHRRYGFNNNIAVIGNRKGVSEKRGGRKASIAPGYIWSGSGW